MQVVAFVVNAFTANGKGGNPAGVVFDADDLSEAQMLQVAATLGFSETAFVSTSSLATYRVRFFTPVEEVDLCGHATIATWSLLYQRGMVKSGDYTQETLAGILGVQMGEDGAAYMQQARPQFDEMITVSEISALLGISGDGFATEAVPQVVSTGLRDLIVLVKDKQTLNSIQPDYPAMIALSKKYDVSGLHVAVLLKDEISLATARNFAPIVGIDEESATGTANGALLCYLKHHELLPDREEYRIEQGKNMNQLSYILGKFVHDDIWIGGVATVFRQTELTL